MADSQHTNTENKTVEARYQRAQTLLGGFGSTQLVQNATLYPVWIGDSDNFWYERETRKGKNGVGKEYRLVNAQTATNNTAFNHQALAATLAEVVKEEVDANNLPLNKMKMDLQGKALMLRFIAYDKYWQFETETETLTTIKAPAEDFSLSPDGQYQVFKRDFNLWVRHLDNGEERALTHDGEEEYGYAIAGSAWGQPDGCGLHIRWSPDSKQIFTVQKDLRQVKTLPTMQHVPRNGSVRPTVTYAKVAYPGDEHVEQFRLLAINIESGHLQEANYRRIPTVRWCDGYFNANQGWWGADNRLAYFVDMERDYKTVRVVEFDTHTGATRILFEETTNTQINLMADSDELPTCVMPLPDTKELLWFSERSGWGHLYLYNLETGELKNTVTSGDWLVRHVIHLDSKRRQVFVQTAGRDAAIDPYYCDLVRIDLDSGEITTLATSNHDYGCYTQSTHNAQIQAHRGDTASACGVSASGNYAIVTRGRADEVPVSFLLDRDGREVLALETADVSMLPEGWQWPEPIKLLAADGKTDIYGQVFRPSDFSPEQSYPIVSHVFNTPERKWVSKSSFSNGESIGRSYYDAAALAELGFIVVQVDGRGTPGRHKAFQNESYGWTESASAFDDHIAGIRQLAERYPYMDLNRVGITSHTSGGPGGIQGLLQHPGFYSVGVNGILHDSRMVGATMWGEKYEGASGPSAAPLATHNNQYHYPEQLAENLQGKLLIMHGMADPVNPPATVFRLVEALQKAYKDFDLLLLPNWAHTPSSYAVLRAWNHLVKHLLNTEPPKDFKLTDVLNGWP